MTTTKTLPVTGMHCASCAGIITRKLKKLDGVEEVAVNIGSEKAKVVYDSKKITLKQMNAEIGKLGYLLQDHEHEAEPVNQDAHTMPDGTVMSGMDHSQHLGIGQTASQKLEELEKQRHLVEFTLPISLLMFVFSLWDIFRALFSGFPELPIPMSILNPLLFFITTVVFMVAGKIFILGVIRFIRYRAANMDTLVGIGTLSAYLYSAFVTWFPALAMKLGFPLYTYFDVSIVIIGFILLGKYLEARSKLQTGEAIEKLLGLQSKTALVERDGKEVEIPIEELMVDEIFHVRSGDKFAVDGKIVEGASSVDESMITGESMPVDKKEGDVVIGGTVNKQGFLKVKATKIGKETMLMQIVKMVEDAQGSKAPIEAIADKVSSVFVPIVMVIAMLTFVAWVVAGLTGLLPLSAAISLGFISTVGVLVIACPCALGLATPTAIITATGRGASHGILIKDAQSLEMLHKISVVMFDKTGTLTKGQPQVTDVISFSHSSNEIVRIAAHLEKKSAHPLAVAIMNEAKKLNIAVGTIHDHRTIEGKGLEGELDNKKVQIGNAALFGKDIEDKELEHAFATLSTNGKTVMMVGQSGSVIGLIAVADVIKDESKPTVAALHKLGIKVAMVTGDHKNVATTIARQLGIDLVYAQVLPGEKADKVIELQQKGQRVVFVGDGINDAPALAQADVGIAMGSGTDVAIEAADVTLLAGNLEKLVSAIRLSRITFAVIKQNLVWAFGYNIVGIPVAAGILYPFFGITLSPVFAGAAMALSSVSVVLNSLRLKRAHI